MSEEQDLESLVGEIGASILDKTKAALEGEWELLTDEDKEHVARAAKRLAKMEAKHRLLGEEPNEENLKVLRATIQNWKMVGQIKATKVQSAFLEALKGVAGVAGSFLAAFVKSMIPLL